MISNEKEFYTVGYSEWGRWQVRKAPVDDPTRYSLVEDLGPSLKAAYLEADGDFQYFPGEDHISLVTEGLPWLFVITDSGDLYVKRVLDPIGNAILLDVGVIQASVCRGWKSELFNVDSGLFVVYRKATGAYLRTYLKVDNVYTWTEVQQLTSGVCNRVEVKRLNDFRIGVYLDNPNRILLSPRYYIGGTAKTEFVSVDVDTEFRIFSLCREDGEKDPFEVVSVTLHGTDEVWVQGNYPFYSRDSRWDDLTYTGTTPGQGVQDWYIESGLLKIKLAIPVVSEYTYLQFSVRALNRLRFERTPQSRPIVPALTITYTPPAVPVSENVSVQHSTSLDISVRPVTIYRYNLDENVDVSYAVSLNKPFKPVTFLNNQFEESVSVSYTSSLTFSVSLAGDVPI